MKRKDIEKKFYEIVADIFKRNPEEIKDSTDFVSDLNAKSVDIMALIAATESAFGIKTERDQTAKNKNVKQAIDYIEKKLKEKAK
ncbi:MAG: acyl carrier protein [Candidatus Pacearchaeota archaeon]